MFWRFGGYANISSLDSILDKPDVTVEELLDEQDLIQELKQQNSKLIEYLRNENVLEQLLAYVIAPKIETEESPTELKEFEEGDKGSGKTGGFFSRRRRSSSVTKSEADEEENKDKKRLNYAYVASEILSSEVWSISEALLENQESLRKFWEYLKRPAPLEAAQAGYFTKVNESLMDKKTEEMLEFYKSIPNVVPDMLQHVDCPMIMDLLLKIISLEKAEGGVGIVDWLQTQRLMPQLLSFLSPEHNSATQTSAGDFLKAIITISANATTQDASVIGPNELTRQLVSEECVVILINEMLRGGNPLTVGVGIVIEVIRKNNSDYDVDDQTGPIPKTSDPIYLGTLLRQFGNHVPDFMALINNPDHVVKNSDGTTTTRKRELQTAFGKPIEPLGFDRFKTCELMAELLHCSNMALLNERGAESDIKRRDIERDRLKAEGKLPPPGSADFNDFGTSVDSSGFHHAKAPSQASDSPEDLRRLEVQNSNEEEDFEKVTASEALPEGKEEVIEKDPANNPTQTSPTEKPTSDPEKEAEKKADAAQGESPTSAGLADKVGGLGLQTEDTQMANSPGNDELPPKSPTSGQQTSLLSKQLSEATDTPPSNVQDDNDDDPLSPHPEDKPAPLFSKRESSLEAPKMSPEQETEGTQPQDIPEHNRASVLLNAHEGDYGSPYEVDIDGSPVVGDLLKMMFVEHKVVPTILDFFFRFPWNNFLHNVVYDVVQQVFNGNMERGYNRHVAIDLFETGSITNRIVEGQEASDKAQAEIHMRLGYMGHLTLIAEEAVKFTERHPPELLSQTVLDKVLHQSWNDYVEHTLTETRERDNAILGGVRPDMAGGPRQAVLNAVGAGQFGGGSLVSAGLSGNGNVGLDSMELSDGGGSGGLYGFGGAEGGSLSGFQNSSDEEDEDMEEGEIGDEGIERSSADDEQSSGGGIAPPPLNVTPSRARRQFAARLAERKKAMEAAASNNSSSFSVDVNAALSNSSTGSDTSTDSGDDDLREAGDIEIGLEGIGPTTVLGDIGESGTVFSPPSSAGMSGGGGLAAMLGIGSQKKEAARHGVAGNEAAEEDDGSEDEGVQIKTAARRGGGITGEDLSSGKKS